MVQRAASTVLVAFSVRNHVQQAAFEVSQRTTALVTTAEANARCPIQTNQMQAAPAQDIANRFMISKGVSDADREEVQSAPGYDDLMCRYINEQGGYEDLVRKLR